MRAWRRFHFNSRLQVRATGKVAEWRVQPATMPARTRTPMMGFSQAGCDASQRKVAVIEPDPNGTKRRSTSATPYLDAEDARRPRQPISRYKAEIDGLCTQNPQGAPIGNGP